MARKAAPKSAKNTKGKRRVSSVRGSTVKKRNEGVEVRGIAGVIVLCVGLLALISQFIRTNGGLTYNLALLSYGLGGSLCLLLPMVLCWAGVTLVFFTSGKVKAKTTVCGALTFLIVATLLQLFQVRSIEAAVFADGASDTYLTFLVRSFKSAAKARTGGGLLGALMAWPLYKALDIWGAVIVLLFAAVIVLMVFTGVSFTGVGMYLSEALDNLRITMNERSEERNALRQSREEEALKAEAELAAERRRKREEKERIEKERAEKARAEKERAEKERAEQERKAQEAEAGDGQENAPESIGQQERPKAGKRKGKPKLEVVRPHEKQADEPPIQTAPHGAYKPAKQIGDDMPLYIERDDAFQREDIDMRLGERKRARKNSFTIEEAENAFLYGINSENAGEGPEIYARQGRGTWRNAAYEADARLYQGAGAAQQDEAEYAGETQYGEEIQYADEAQYGEEIQYADETQYGEEIQYADEAQYGEEIQYAGEARYAEDMHGAQAPRDTEELQYAGTAQPARRLRRVRTPLSEPQDQDEGETPLQRSILAAQRAAEGKTQKVQDVLAAQAEAARDKTVVQLRGTRPDGTPLVVPRKDPHEAPKILNDEYVYPPIDLLNQVDNAKDPNRQAKIEEGAQRLLDTLESFGVQASLINVTHGPAITRYELKPAAGVKVSRIVNLVDDIALNMASDGVRIEAPIPGKPAVGIEVPNEKTEMVSLREVLESEAMRREKSPTVVALGKGISGRPVVVDIAKMPHVLVAGSTGSGKSVCINTVINSIIFRASPREVRLILIDPKVVELSVYNGIPHLLVPVVTDPKKASAALSWACVEMDHRYKRFETLGVRNIEGYNAKIGEDEEPMSKIIVVIDELADLMMVAPGDVEESICRLAQKARAAGIHLIIATQSPRVNVITGLIKANIPSRIAFAVANNTDSRIILDANGAEKLLGKGDMLYVPQGAGKPTRVQGCFVSDGEVERVVEFVRGRHEAGYSEDIIEQMEEEAARAAEASESAKGDLPAEKGPGRKDELLDKAIEMAIDAGQVSISMIQRRLRVGYARAGHLVDDMESMGMVGEAQGPTKPRKVLITREEWRRMQENQE